MTATTEKPKQRSKQTKQHNQPNKIKSLNLRKENNSVQAKGISDSPKRITSHEGSCFKKQGH